LLPFICPLVSENLIDTLPTAFPAVIHLSSVPP